MKKVNPILCIRQRMGFNISNLFFKVGIFEDIDNIWSKKTVKIM